MFAAPLAWFYIGCFELLHLDTGIRHDVSAKNNNKTSNETIHVMMYN